MNDTLHGGEAWSRPCERDRGRVELAGGRVVDAGLLCLSRSLVGENEADFQRPRLHDHVIDIPLDQVTIIKGGRVLLRPRDGGSNSNACVPVFLASSCSRAWADSFATVSAPMPSMLAVDGSPANCERV
jgi:hypothetical protein